jgi:hypothetical protein
MEHSGKLVKPNNGKMLTVFIPCLPTDEASGIALVPGEIYNYSL